MSGLWTVWSTPLFHTTQNDQYRQYLQEFQSKSGFVQFPDDRPIPERACDQPKTNHQKITDDARTFGRRARQRHTKTSRIRETCRHAAGETPRCGDVFFSGGGITSPPQAFVPTPRPRIAFCQHLCTFSIPPPVSRETSLNRPDLVEVLDLPSSVPLK